MTAKQSTKDANGDDFDPTSGDARQFVKTNNFIRAK